MHVQVCTCTGMYNTVCVSRKPLALTVYCCCSYSSPTNRPIVGADKITFLKCFLAYLQMYEGVANLYVNIDTNNCVLCNLRYDKYLD